MDQSVTIALSAIPIPGNDLPLDIAIATEELLRNTLEATGLNHKIKIFRNIGVKNYHDAFRLALYNNAKFHVLFTIHHSFRPVSYQTVPTVATLQHRDADLFESLCERLEYNNCPARFQSFKPTLLSDPSLSGLLTWSFEKSCDTACLTAGSYHTQTQLKTINQYAPTLARATAQALYRRAATPLQIQEQRGVQSGAGGAAEVQVIGRWER